MLLEKTQIKVTSNTAILGTDFGNDIDCIDNGGILIKTLPFFSIFFGFTNPYL